MSGCQHSDTWFDRSLCPCQDGGAMHTICTDCGTILGDPRHAEWEAEQPRPLLYDDPASVERLAAALLAWGSPSNIGLWDDGGRTAAAAIIERLRGEG